MKKFIKSALSIALVVTMLLSLGAVAFAENPGVISSHVEFEVTADGVLAKALVNDLKTTYPSGSSYTPTGTTGMLIFAAYDANGVLTNAVSDVGLNRILKTEAVSIPEGGSAKAFVWENKNEKVISNVAVYKASGYDFEDVLDTLEITFGGQSFENFVGTAFNKATTTYNAGKLTSLPNIKATVDDNATYVNAYATDSAYTVEVKSSIGKSSENIGTVYTHRGNVSYADNSVSIYRPAYTDSRTYTINYTIVAPTPTKINPDKELLFLNKANLDKVIVPGKGTAATNVPDETNRGMINAASAEVNLKEGAKTAKVDVYFPSNPRQNMFIVVRPQNGEKGINNKVIVNSDGTELSSVVNQKSYSSRVLNDDKTISGNWYQMSKNRPVTITSPDGSKTDSLYVTYELNDDTANGATGAPVFNRNSRDKLPRIVLANETMQNAEFIPFDLATNDSNGFETGGTFTFYVGQDAVVDVYTYTSDQYYNTDTPAVTGIEIKADDVKIEDVKVKTSEKALFSYTANPPLGWIKTANIAEDYQPYINLMLAYFDYKGYKQGVDYEYDETNKAIRKFSSIEPLRLNHSTYNSSSDIRSIYGQWTFIGLSATGENIKVGENQASANIINPANDARFWKDGVIGGTPKTRAELADLFDDNYTWPKAAKFELPATDIQLVQKFSEFAEKYGLTYGNDSLCTPDIVQFIPGNTTGAVLDVYSDAHTVSAYVTDYDTLFGFEGGAVIRPQLEWNNGGFTPLTMANGQEVYKYQNKDGATLYGPLATANESGNTNLGFYVSIPATVNTPLYTFNVTHDSIVYVLTPHGYSYARTDVNLADGWIASSSQPVNMLVTDKAPSMFANNGNQQYAFKYFDAGSTVTINVPENGVRPIVIVKPL